MNGWWALRRVVDKVTRCLTSLGLNKNERLVRVAPPPLETALGWPELGGRLGSSCLGGFPN